METHADNGAGCHGLAQWCESSGRWQQVVAAAGGNDKKLYGFDFQMNYLIKDFRKDGYGNAYSQMRNDKPSLSTMTYDFEQLYEQCGTIAPTQCNDAKRQQNATNLYNYFHRHG